MRITRLLLARYGHLSDKDLHFAPGAGLHIVLGANEAGKSTALSAIADALFGFPNQTPFAFLHDQKNLRVGIGLRGADGREAFFLRRKGKADNSLKDAADQPVPDSALASFLQGASRDRFTKIFGMDSVELRRGGADILDGKGEIGESILQAHTGLKNVRGALARLNEDALKLYGDKRPGRAVHEAAARFRQAKQDLDTRSVRSADYEAALRDRENCLSKRRDNALEAAGLQAERAKLDRIRRTAPARAALLRDRPALAALGDIRTLPENAEERRGKAVEARAFLSLERNRKQAAQEEDAQKFALLAVDEVLLGQADAIDALSADLNRIAGAKGDRERQILAAAQAQARVEEAGRRLGLALDADTLVKRMPGDPARAAAQRALKTHTALTTQAQTLEADRARALASREAALKNLETAPPPEPAEALIAAIESAKAEGRIDADLALAEDDAAAARKTVAAALAALPLWSGSLEELESAKLPLTANIAIAEAELAASAQDLAERRREVSALDQASADVQADLQGFLAAGQPPTAEAVAAARERRDRAWHLIRRHRLQGGAAPTQDEVLGLPPDLEDGFFALMAEADTLADRRVGEASRVASYEQLLTTQARCLHQRERARAAELEASDRADAARSAWVGLWQGAGVVPGDAAAMREWRVLRDRVLAALAEMRRKETALLRLRARFEAAHARLAAVCREPSPEGKGSLDWLLRAAERRRAAHEAALRAHEQAVRAAGEAERNFADIAAREKAFFGKMGEWRQAWGRAAISLGLPEDSEAEAGADALAVWAEVDKHARDWRSATERVAEMTASIEAFGKRVAEVARCAPDLQDAAPEAAVRALASRLAEAKDAARARVDLRQKLEAHGAEIKSLDDGLFSAQDELAALRQLAGVDDDDALPHAIARAREAALLAAQIRAREAELHGQDDGMSFAALEEEAQGMELSAVPGRIAEIDARLSVIGVDNEALARTLADAERRLAEMEKGHNAAEAAQRCHDAAAEAAEAAQRYVRLRLGHTLLRAGVEKFRREQQAPLLAEAGTLFAALTEGRYTKLSVEEEDGKMVVVALRPDGKQCPAARLSEGTRDQLYLALRLAAIRGHAAAGETLPFIADDLLASFDDTRARAALRTLQTFGQSTQTILFTHHAHIAAMAGNDVDVKDLLF